MKLLLAAIMLFISSITYAQQVNPATLTSQGQRVWNRVLELNNQVFGSKDSTLIKPVVHRNLHYGHSSGKLENMPQMVHNAAVNAATYRQLSHQLISMKVMKDVAVVRYILKAISVENNVDSPLELGIIQVWTKDKAQWLLLERQAVKLTPTKR